MSEIVHYLSDAEQIVLLAVPPFEKRGTTFPDYNKQKPYELDLFYMLMNLRETVSKL